MPGQLSHRIVEICPRSTRSTVSQSMHGHAATTMRARSIGAWSPWLSNSRVVALLVGCPSADMGYTTVASLQQSALPLLGGKASGLQAEGRRLQAPNCHATGTQGHHEFI